MTALSAGNSFRIVMGAIQFSIYLIALFEQSSPEPPCAGMFLPAATYSAPTGKQSPM